MPAKEFDKSLKAKLYDFTYTPFMSSMVIAWIVINHKYILIYLASSDLDKKLELLKNYDFSCHTPWFDILYMQNIIAPILFGLFYTFIYPKISKQFYKYTLNEKKELKKEKQKIEELTPVLEEDAKAIKADNYEKTKKITELQDTISGIEDRHSEAVKVIKDDHAKSIKEIKRQFRNEMEKEFEERTEGALAKCTELGQINQTLIEENSYLRQFEPATEMDDETKILKYFYTKNYKTRHIERVMDSIYDWTKIPRPKVEKIISTLINKRILRQDHGNLLSITDAGNSYLIGKFDHREE